MEDGPELDRLLRSSKRSLRAGKQYLEASKRFQQHFVGCKEDLVLLTLKGHLLIEELLASILVEKLEIEQQRLPQLLFQKKLDVVRAIVCSRNLKTNADVLHSIKDLNEIRNKLAHLIEDEATLGARISKLVKDHDARVGRKRSAQSGDIASELRRVLTEMWGFLVVTRGEIVCSCPEDTD